MNLHRYCPPQRAKKVMSNSPGLVDFAIGLVNSVLTCPTGKWYFLSNLNNRRTVKSILLVKKILGLVEMTSGLVNASFSLPEWQAVKIIFFAPCTWVNTLYSSRMRHFRSDHGTGAEMCLAFLLRNVSVSYWPVIFPCLHFQPQKSLRTFFRPGFLPVSYCVLRHVTGQGRIQELPGSVLIG